MLDVDLQKLLATFAATFGDFCSDFWQILQRVLFRHNTLFCSLWSWKL